MYREVSFYVKPDLHFEAYRKLGFMKTEDGEPLGGGSIDVAAGFGIEDSDDDFLS